VEGHNFEIRKHLLEYDDVMNQQREVIYRQRRETLSGKDLSASVQDMIAEQAEAIADEWADEHVHAEEWNFEAISENVFKAFNFKLPEPDADTLDGLTADGLAQYIIDLAMERYHEKERLIGKEDFRRLERMVMLQTVDGLWKDHLLSMDHLKEGIGLRGYGQQNPLLVYKKEAFEMFQEMIDRVKEETVGILFRIQIAAPEELEEMQEPNESDLVYSGGEGAHVQGPAAQ
jgi:preprotein translocase subunit SecA